MMHDCSTNGHIGKIAKTQYRLEDGDVKESVALYGCTKCDTTSSEPWPDWGQIKPNPDHTGMDDCDCFGCKARGLQLSTGDANGKRIMSSKSFDGELNSYYDATRQGIEPVSTKRKDIEAAVRLSNDTGTAFNGNNI